MRLHTPQTELNTHGFGTTDEEFHKREPVSDKGVQTISKHPQLRLILQDLTGTETKPFD